MADETTEHGGRPAQPASRRVAAELRDAIDVGEYQPGDKLPSYRDLTASHGIALNTAQAAVRLLEQEGRVTTKPGRGAFVVERTTPPPADVQLRELRAELTQLREAAREAGGTLAAVEQRLDALIAGLASS